MVGWNVKDKFTGVGIVFGQKDICLGVPVVIGRNGWEKILDFGLDAEEQALFNKSADAVRSMNDVLKTL